MKFSINLGVALVLAALAVGLYSGHITLHKFQNPRCVSILSAPLLLSVCDVRSQLKGEGKTP